MGQKMRFIFISVWLLQSLDLNASTAVFQEPPSKVEAVATVSTESHAEPCLPTPPVRDYDSIVTRTYQYSSCPEGMVVEETICRGKFKVMNRFFIGY